jgi:hypothetical protein
MWQASKKKNPETTIAGNEILGRGPESHKRNDAFNCSDNLEVNRGGGSFIPAEGINQITDLFDKPLSNRDLSCIRYMFEMGCFREDAYDFISYEF